MIPFLNLLIFISPAIIDVEIMEIAFAALRNTSKFNSILICDVCNTIHNFQLEAGYWALSAKPVKWFLPGYLENKSFFVSRCWCLSKTFNC